jgi:hypothetical protein
MACRIFNPERLAPGESGGARCRGYRAETGTPFAAFPVFFPTPNLPLLSTGALHVNDRNLATYLNDHLAGAVAGMELIDHICRLYAGQPGERVATHIRDAIAADRKDLDSLMTRLKITQSAPRKATAWLSEKFAEIKVKLDDVKQGSLRRLELWEALSVGIEGKRLLWVSLGSVVEGNAELGLIDLAKLEKRAEEQRRDVEMMRVKAAKAAFGDGD